MLAALLCVFVLAVGSTEARAGFSYGEEEFSAPDSAQTFNSMDCGSDLDAIAIGAGYRSFSQNADFIYLSALYPQNDPPFTWGTYTDNFTGGQATNHPEETIVCDNDPGPGQYKQRSSGSVTVPDATQKSATASCKKREIVVGGGVYNGSLYADETEVSASGPVDDNDRKRIPEDGWRAAVNNDEGGSATESIIAYAICDRNRTLKKVRYRRDTEVLVDGQLGSLEVGCRADETLLGGGLRSDSKYQHGVYVVYTAPPNNVPGESWVGGLHNSPTPDAKSRKLTVTAICL